MKEVKGNIWDYHKKGHWIVITTNGTIKANGEAVMGRGIALQAKQRFSGLPLMLGRKTSKYGNVPYILPEFRLVTLPVKHNWWEQADVRLIADEIAQLGRAWTLWDNKLSLYLVRPGCGNGRLDWKDVKPVLEKYLDDRFIVVEKEVTNERDRN